MCASWPLCKVLVSSARKSHEAQKFQKRIRSTISTKMVDIEMTAICTSREIWADEVLCGQRQALGRSEWKFQVLLVKTPINHNKSSSM